MKYLAMLIRVVIIVIWIFMIVQNPEPRTPPFCSWVVFILVWIYFTLLATVWPKALLCPFKNMEWGCCKK